RRVAAGAGEDEHDRRQQRGVVEQLDDLRAARRPLETPAVLRAAAPAAPAPVRRAVLAGTARTMPAAGALAPAVAAAPRPAGALVHGEGEGGDPLDLGIDPTFAAGARAVGDDGLPVGVDEQVQQLLP